MSKSNTKEKRKPSTKSLTNIKVMTFCGLMGAVAIVLNYVATFQPLPWVRVGFSGLPNQAVAYLFGPVIGAIFGFVMDFLKLVTKPTGAYFPGYGLTAIVAAIIYGLFTHNRPVKLWRVIVAQVIVKIFCNLGLNSIWSVMLTGKAIYEILPSRVISNATMIVPDIILMYLMLLVIQQYIKPHFEQ